MATNSTNKAAAGINSSNKDQSTAALLVQAYCNSVQMQPKVDFSKTKNLKDMEKLINDGLLTAQNHATKYLNEIQPNIIKNITNIDGYYHIHNSVESACPPGTSIEKWQKILTALKNKSTTYKNDAEAVAKSLQDLHNELTHDAATFAGVVVALNTQVNGDNGILKSNQEQLDSIQSKIDGAIAGIVASGIAVVGGVFMVAVGGVADFVTAGTSTPLVVGGVAVVCAGVGGTVASAIVLDKLNDQKAKLIAEDSQLTAEVNLATGISGAYTSLGHQLKNAVDAANAMQNAWRFLSDDLGSLISNLNDGNVKDEDLQQLFLPAANKDVQTVSNDIATIKMQMTGISNVTVKSGQTVGKAIIEAANEKAAA
jgi:non-hemolytic enterotoxin B/C